MSKKKKRKARDLVLQYLEEISSTVFSDYPREITALAANRHGVYALAIEKEAEGLLDGLLKGEAKP